MNTNKLGVKSILVSLPLALFGVTGFAACAVPADSSEEAVSAGEEQVGEAEGALGQCCYGYFRCPTTSQTFPYATGPSICRIDGEWDYYGSAQSDCDAACVPACQLVQQYCLDP